ncbi:MAG: hypothetical protein QN229_06045 [Desulfurococcaceae archaeon TW002]
MSCTQPPHTIPLSNPGGVSSACKVLSAVIILSREDDFIHRYLTYDLVKESVRGKYKRIELYVISPLPSPLYLKQIRDLLLSNIHVGIIVKYSGYGVDSLKKLLGELVKSGNDVKLYSSRSLGDEYLEVIKQFGITPILVGESS